jgi:hypothetical protein
MDEMIKKLAAFGIPGIILLVAMVATGLSGAAALTAALAALGPFGMVGGIALLIFIGLSADKISEFGFEKITILVIKEQLKQTSKEEMIKKIESYPITRGMKLKVIDFVNRA